MATPHVSGVAALLKSKNPSADDAALKAQILQSVDKKAGLSGKTATGGRLNAAQALGVPTVSSVTPPDRGTGVARDTNVTATFSEDIDSRTLTNATVTLVRAGSTTPVEATVSCDNPCRTLTLDPTKRLADRKTYTATIKGAKDMTGNSLPTTVWSFKTGRR
jgi:subtilisin family serine protease